MALRKLRTDDDPVLRKPTKQVKEITDRVKLLIEDMFDTMYHEQGVGLAAPQVGILKRICVIDIYEGTPYVLINPVIIQRDGEQVGPEGCLSFPGRVGEVSRPNHVIAEATNLEGERYQIEGEGLLARAICHELDHLDGKVFVDIAEDLHYESEDQ